MSKLPDFSAVPFPGAHARAERDAWLERVAREQDGPDPVWHTPERAILVVSASGTVRR